jgi:aspartate-semialdehyde dehydrogenase
MAITLKPLMDEMGLESVFMTSLQAVSGAGRSPGVIAYQKKRKRFKSKQKRS